MVSNFTVFKMYNKININYQNDRNLSIFQIKKLLMIVPCHRKHQNTIHELSKLKPLYILYPLSHLSGFLPILTNNAIRVNIINALKLN